MVKLLTKLNVWNVKLIFIWFKKIIVNKEIILVLKIVMSYILNMILVVSVMMDSC